MKLACGLSVVVDLQSTVMIMMYKTVYYSVIKESMLFFILAVGHDIVDV